VYPLSLPHSRRIKDSTCLTPSSPVSTSVKKLISFSYHPFYPHILFLSLYSSPIFPPLPTLPFSRVRTKAATYHTPIHAPFFWRHPPARHKCRGSTLPFPFLLPSFFFLHKNMMLREPSFRDHLALPTFCSSRSSRAIQALQLLRWPFCILRFLHTILLHSGFEMNLAWPTRWAVGPFYYCPLELYPKVSLRHLCF